MINSQLRVLFASHTYVVGINQGKLDAVAATGKAEVGLLVPGRWQARAWNKLFKLEKLYPRIQYYPAQVFFGGRGGGYVYAPTSVSHALNHFRPDILQVEQEIFSLSALEMAVWARLTKTPLVIFVWENQDRQLSFLRQWMSRFVLDTADLIVAGNEDGKQVLQRWGYTKHIEVMPQMGVDTTIFSPHLHKRRTANGFLIGYMGRLVQCKGIDLLFAAAQQLQQQGHQFQVVLCGSGSEEGALRKQAQDMGVADLIVWQGKVPHADVPKEMGKFDVLVLPSRSVATWKEQFGHVLIEAMSMGVPVVGSTCGEIPNVIGRSDLVFEEEDASGLAHILARMIREPEWHEDVGNYGIDRVQKYYTHERIAQRLIDEWFKVLKERRYQEEVCA